MTGLRICLIASSRFPIAEPFAGGLEAHTHSLAAALIARGHEVTLFAAAGSDPALPAEALEVDDFLPTAGARRDISAAPDVFMRDHHAYLSLMLDLQRTGHRRFDIVHNNCLHHLPVAMAPALDIPLVTTLHTPPTPWLESAMRLAGAATTVIAVSEATATQWADTIRAEVIRNGVDVREWAAGSGGTAAVWFGRIVPEKGAHLAIDAARTAGMDLVLAGPRHDPSYFDQEIAPRLGPDVRYAGHLSGEPLRQLVRSSRVAVVTPCWDEPYGLVAAEAMACGTPVAAFDRGGLAEIVTPGSGRLAAPGDVPALAAAMLAAGRLPREGVRRHAETQLSIERMVDEYEDLYLSLTRMRAAA
ncbi:MAG: glycosyltransferase [Microbacterium sp.]|uniref:glycosyltransferase n=1 Tax=Microbacterium sp. TaxID=51671 RepID=UPI0026218B9B|nr:glycosyltransferase [Microbacterium sp.]MCX6501433.1 glycosyltransferase [Microbacterium sp.]